MTWLETTLALVWVHTMADFVAQTDRMAMLKSKSNGWLLLHTFVYGLLFVPFGWLFALVNFAAHTATDWLTSRCTSRLWAASVANPSHKAFGKSLRGWFFVVIGIDQAIHITTLVATWAWLGAT